MTPRSRWRRREAEVPISLGGLHPVVARVLAARGVDDPASLAHSLADMHRPELLSGLDAALDLLETVLRRQQHLLVIGDFDADGATSTALAVRALTQFGLQRVSYRVPDRFRFGYGLTPAIVDSVRDLDADVIMTVDNGVSSIDGVARATELGMQVLVTDHHLPGRQLPAAAAMVNPNLDGDAFPSKALAGVGVVFYLLAALRSRLLAKGWFDQNELPPPNMAGFLDLVALGTVADVVPLDANNRILVEQGLRRIRAGQCRPGIQALLEVARREPTRAAPSDLGYAVGPRINAAGRLDDMSLGIECLLCDDLVQARRLAQVLEDLNRERREIEGEMQTQALASLAALQRRLGETDRLPAGLVLYEREWHQGVVGLVAGRIKERYHRPVVAFADDEQQQQLKGSARSVPGLHIRDALDAVATSRPGLITRFGGHAMAAGLSLPREHLPEFRAAFDEQVRRCLGEQPPVPEIWSDGPLHESDHNIDLARTLRYIAPWGQHFPEPSFDGEFLVETVRLMQDRHLKLQVRARDGGQALTALAFNWVDGERDVPGTGQHLRLLYRLDVNEYRGESSLQLMIEHLEVCT